MGWLDQLRGLLRREAADAKAWLDDTVADANAELDQAERRQSADPEVALQATLDDIAASSEAYEDVRARAEGRTVAPAAASSVAAAHAGEPGSGEASTGEASTGEAMARLWVHEQPTSSRAGYHELRLDEVVARVVGQAWLTDSLVPAVEALPEVEDASLESPTVLHVRGPALTPALTRRLVAATLAPQIGEDWERRLTPGPPGT